MIHRNEIRIYASSISKVQFGFLEELRFNHIDHSSDIRKSLWPFLYLSRIMGMCPITRAGNKMQVYEPCHITWMPVWFGLILRGFVWSNFVYLSIYKDYSNVSIVQQVHIHIFHFQILLDSLYMVYRAKDIPILVHKCKYVEELLFESCSRTGYKDRLVITSYFIFAIIVTSRLLGSVIYFCSVFWSFEQYSDFANFFNNQLFIKSNDVYIGTLYAVVVFYNDVVWGYADILISLLAVTFKTLFCKLNKHLSQVEQPSLNEVEKYRRYHREICHLVKICNDIFSILFLLTYIGNVACLLTRLYQGVGYDQNHSLTIVQIESYFAISYLALIKILLPSYLGSKLNSEAHKTLCLVQRWSCPIDSPNAKEKLLVIGRFVSDISAQEIGLSGCGYFIITKKFLVTIVSAIITYEIIILQFQVSSCKIPKP